jgi:hypothetical protein
MNHRLTEKGRRLSFSHYLHHFHTIDALIKQVETIHVNKHLGIPQSCHGDLAGAQATSRCPTLDSIRQAGCTIAEVEHPELPKAPKFERPASQRLAHPCRDQGTQLACGYLADAEEGGLGGRSPPAAGFTAWSRPGFEDQVQRGFGGPPEPGEARLGEDLTQPRFPGLGAEAEGDILGERVRGADGR